jgi:hypothetical protein
MHVYLREEPVEMEMREIDPEGMVPEGADLVAVAFFVNGNEQPSFRALLPAETIEVLSEATQTPVQLGLLAEEPAETGAEVHAMVGISVAVRGPLPEELEAEPGSDEPWKSASADAWKGEAWKERDDIDDAPRAALLAFAPLVRLKRKFPDSFGDELADLLEAALAGATKPNLEARVDRMLEDL